MKKISSLLLTFVISFSRPCFSALPSQNPYNIGPEGRTIEDLTNFAKPKDMVSILPNRPIQATDSSGNRQFFTTTGSLALSISKDGSVTFSLSGQSKTVDSKGNLKKEEKSIIGTNITEVRNEFGEIVSYKEKGIGGQIVKEYDKDKNLTKTNVYDSYGKRMVASVNELTKAKTVFDDKGRAIYDLDYEGNRTAKYEYNDKNMLTTKIDMYGNKTYYDENQNPKYIENEGGAIISEYIYIEDKNGNVYLDKTYDKKTGETTYYKDGKQQYTRNQAGAIITEYGWSGSKLVYSFNKTNNETTWYDIDGKALYVAINDTIISKNLYYEGQMVGVWDKRNNEVTIFKNERRELTLKIDDGLEPTGAMVKAWVDTGLIDKKYLTGLM
ncbi:MAG: hypothetical protein LBD57_02755 [Endomicrobium sp.]|jgi:hypothetical protein|uniref:hypothetical protein n=1 Tax=Candidatus Endomicrobiellum cubanum TaxID=3242325 RepID=UPI00283A5BF2|nr:hypothetical protein [Endomicrobium sp.]